MNFTAPFPYSCCSVWQWWGGGGGGGGGNPAPLLSHLWLEVRISMLCLFGRGGGGGGGNPAPHLWLEVRISMLCLFGMGGGLHSHIYVCIICTWLVESESAVCILQVASMVTVVACPPSLPLPVQGRIIYHHNAHTILNDATIVVLFVFETCASSLSLHTTRTKLNICVPSMYLLVYTFSNFQVRL